MAKLMKTLLLSAYGVVLIRYLRNSITSVTDDIVIDYLTQSPIKGTDRKNNLTVSKVNFNKTKRFPTDLKFVLKYTSSFLHYTTSLYKNGQFAFIENKCKYTNCYLTNRGLLFDYRNYDAILFDVENNWDGGLLIREPYQKFIFVASESASNYPLCDNFYNNYYNLTWTYKLDSDIRWSYLTITDKQGTVVGPSINMSWVNPMKATPEDVKEKIKGKKNAAAWFVSNCNAKNRRGDITKAIEKELVQYGHKVDIFGWCGRKTCPKDRFEECLSLLETDYFFYLSFENSFSEDYVTEKVLYPLQHYTVPIVYGGADYTRFLPPDSYIDARKLNASQVAYEMNRAIKEPSVYENYFRWHNHYEYLPTARVPEVCKLCQILNEESHKHSSYKDFLNWWNPDHISTCNQGEGRVLVKDPENDIKLRPVELNGQNVPDVE